MWCSGRRCDIELGHLGLYIRSIGDEHNCICFLFYLRFYVDI